MAVTLQQTPTQPLAAATCQAWLDGIDTFLFDCDGVLWCGSAAVRGADLLLRHLRAHAKRVFFVTNNSTISRAAYTKKFASFGIEAREDEILSSAWAASVCLRNLVGKAFVLGESGLQAELAAAGVAVTTDCSVTELDPEVRAVVVGLDRQCTYEKIHVASAYLRNRTAAECQFVATNTDSVLPTDKGLAPPGAAGGTFAPGAGALIAAVATSSGRAVDLLVGKPSQNFLDLLIQTHPTLERARTVMVGDRLDTDMQFASDGRLQSLLVFSGVASPADLEASPLQPNHCVGSVTDIAAWLGLF